jgi:hypothetical protein
MSSLYLLGEALGHRRFVVRLLVATS